MMKRTMRMPSTKTMLITAMTMTVSTTAVMLMTTDDIDDYDVVDDDDGEEDAKVQPKKV